MSRLNGVFVWLAIMVLFMGVVVVACGDDDDDDDGIDGDDDDTGDDDDNDSDDDTDDDDDTAADDDDTATDDDDSAGEIVWIVEQVDSVGAGSRQTDIELGDDGAIHLVYTGCVDSNCAASALAYAVKQGEDDDWATTTVDSVSNDTGWFPSLSVGDAGDLYVTYGKHSNSSDHRLRFAMKQSDQQWANSAIGTGDGGFWTSNVIAGGVFYMAHTSFPSGGMIGNLQVGAFDGTWNFEILDDQGDCGWFTTMAATPAGMPVVTHIQGYPAGYLKVLTFDGTAWNPVQVDGGSYGADIAVDENGFYHLVYAKNDSVHAEVWDLWYTTNAPDGSWQKTLLDGGATEDEDTGGFPAVAIDANGGVHVTYRNFTKDALMYARNVTGEWEYATADAIGGGLYSSLVADEDGGVHVVYENGNTLLYGLCATCGALE
jgi:hypothetical protein